MAAFSYCARFPEIPVSAKLFSDGGYQGPQFRDARKKASPFVDTEIIERSDAAEGWPGVRKPQSQSAVVAAPRLHPPHAQKTL
jgi:hypothetical protein